MRRLYIIIFLCFCFSTEGRNEREKFAPEEITVETTNNHHNIDNDEEETPIAEIDQDVENNEEKQDNQEDKSTENRFYYKNQDMHTPHTYKPFCVFRKYMEINHSFSFSRNGIFPRNGFGTLLFCNFLNSSLATTCYQLLSAAFGIVMLWAIPSIIIITSTYLRFCIGLLSIGGLDGSIYFFELLDFLILPYRREYIFFSYKNIKLLYKINYHVGTTMFKTNTPTFKKRILTAEDAQNLKDTICTICMQPFVNKQIMYSHKETHIYHDTCIENWLQYKNTCPICKAANMQLEGDNFNFMNIIKIIFCPELFVEFSSNTTRKYSVIFRILVCGAGINLFIYAPNLIKQNFVIDETDSSDVYCIPIVKCGGEIGIAFSKTLEVLLFVHPQWLFRTNKMPTCILIEKFGIDVGISVRWLV